MAKTTKPGCAATAITGIAGMYIFGIIRSGIESGLACSISGILVLIVLVVLFNIIANIGRNRAADEAGKVSTERNDAASSTVAALRAGHTVPPYCVYLRPFVTTGALEAENLDRQPHSGWDMSKPVKVELETLLSDILADWEINLIALGEPGEHVGAGRVRVDDTEWQEFVTLLVAHASMIYAVPSSTEGTLWEMKHLCQTRLAERTIFIMPPAPNQLFSRREEELLSTMWQKARVDFETHGVRIALPPYSSEGLMFIIDAAGRVKEQRAIGRAVLPEIIAKNIEELGWKVTPMSAL